MNRRAARAQSPDPAARPKRSAPAPGGARQPAGRPAADRVLRQFRVILNAVKTHFQQVERRCGIGGVQVWALALIHDRPGIGVGQLATELNVRQPTASSVVRNLALQGLIEVRREGPDRRSVQLHETAAGRQLLQRAPGPHSGLLPDALGALDPEALGQLETYLGMLIDKLGTEERGATKPLSQL